MLLRSEPSEDQEQEPACKVSAGADTGWRVFGQTEARDSMNTIYAHHR